MRKNKVTANIICELEYNFRYRIRDKFQKYQNPKQPESHGVPVYKGYNPYDKKYDCIKDIPFKTVRKMHYKFDDIDIHIGDALTDILEWLENRYNLDFYQLEQEYEEEMKNLPIETKIAIAFMDSIKMTVVPKPHHRRKQSVGTDTPTE